MRPLIMALPLVCVALMGTPWACSDVKPVSLFCDNMVLQRDMKVPVWGTAEPGEKVAVTLDKFKAEAVADKDGKWKALLGPMPAGGPFEVTIAGKNTLTFKNVLVGDVWLCGGQSNMELTLAGAANAKEEIAKADYPQIRIFRVDVRMADEPQTECKGVWAECKPPGVGWFTAVGYFFARDLQADIKVPIGIINCAVGGTTAQTWVSRKCLESDPELKAIITGWEGWVADFPRQKEQMLAKWNLEVEKAKAEGKPAPPQPWLGDPNAMPWKPSGLYNAMIVPVAPYAIRGAIWYQGESDAAAPKRYRKHVVALIADWRATFAQGDFPFLIVQLPNWMPAKPQPAESGLAEMRESQLLAALTAPNAGVVVTIDIGDAVDIHPKNKQDVGKRLALAARQLFYGEKINGLSPIYDAMKIEGDKIRVSFRNVGSGLEAKGGDLKQFAIAGADKKFVWAQAKIEGNDVVVWSPDVKNPVAVRYAWADTPEGCNLYNKEGLPASPFRTDGPPMPPEPKK